MDWILPRLVLGSLEDARMLAEQPWPAASQWCLFNLCEHFYEANGHILQWHPIADEVYHAPEVWERLVTDLAQAIRRFPRVLVHCRLGKSRSPSLVAAYLVACGQSEHLDAALAYVRRQRWEIEPHPETLRGVRDWWGS